MKFSKMWMAACTLPRCKERTARLMMAGRRRLSSGEGRRRDGQGEREGKGGEDGPEEPREGESAGSKTKGSLSRTYWGNRPGCKSAWRKNVPSASPPEVPSGFYASSPLPTSHSLE